MEGGSEQKVLPHEAVSCSDQKTDETHFKMFQMNWLLYLCFGRDFCYCFNLILLVNNVKTNKKAFNEIWLDR